MEKFSAMIELNSVKFLPIATKFLKKLKDKKLKNLFANAVKKICENPLIGEEKTGDLQGVRCVDVFYNKTNYELAYIVEIVDDKEVIVILMAGTRENFYDALKNYKKSTSYRLRFLKE